MEQDRSHVDRDGLESSRRFESRVLPVTRSIGDLSDQRSFRTTRYSIFGDRSVESRHRPYAKFRVVVSVMRLNPDLPLDVRVPWDHERLQGL